MPADAQRMAERRLGLVHAAERLIRQTKSTDFTMAALAAEAGVSPATPYNHFESKATLLYSLLNRAMDGVENVGLAAFAEPEPFTRAMRAAEAAARYYTADPTYYRVLYRFFLGVADAVHRPAFMDRSIRYWTRATEPLAKAGLMPPQLPPDQLAVEMLIAFIGITDLWALGELSSEAYVARAGYGNLVLMLGIARGRHRDHVLSLMDQALEHLPQDPRFDTRSRIAAGKEAVRRPRTKAHS